MGKRGRKPGFSAMTPERTARQDAIVNVYMSGETLENTGKLFGITRERVRQIVSLRGVSRGYEMPNGYVSLGSISKEMLSRYRPDCIMRMADSVGVKISLVNNIRCVSVGEAKTIRRHIKNRPKCEKCKANLRLGQKYKWPLCHECYLKMRYRLDPEARKKQNIASMKWREKNRERWLKWQREYIKNYYSAWRSRDPEGYAEKMSQYARRRKANCRLIKESNESV